jgi:amidase
MQPVHAFTDDALADHDATALAERVAAGEVSARDLTEAAIARAEKVQGELNGVHVADYARALATADALPVGPFSGVPTFVKDNIDVAGLPTNHGTRAFAARPARKDSPLVTGFRELGLNILGKSRLPEFGFSASTEYVDADPVRNPWDPEYSAGASSGGAAALVAAGVVPVAHANDGGGSIRIPAAVNGLVGLKPTRGRFVTDPHDAQLPVDIVGQGIVSRSVRDTARFFAGMESQWRNPTLPPVRHVTGPSATRLRIGLVLESPSGAPTDPETRAAVEDVARLLEDLGHRVEPARPPVPDTFADDFSHYWALLGFLANLTGKLTYDRSYDASRTEPLTQGLARMFRKGWKGTPGMLWRLRRSQAAYRAAFSDLDLYLSPVLSHTTPVLGHLAADQPGEELFDRLQRYVGFTPLNNATGSPAMSLPLARTSNGLPLGVHFSADVGDERSLLELAYELEEARPFARIQDATPVRTTTADRA